MKSLYKYTLFAASLCTFTAVSANEAVKAALAKAMPTVKIDSLTPSQVPGLQEVVIPGAIFYISDDGKYLLQGHLIDIEAKKDITEEKLAALRLKELEAVGKDNMIIFKAEKPKYTVSIFTDIDCGYCRKLHSEMDQYLAAGISIQYLFFPRAGKGSESYDKAVSIWCAKDRKKALTAAKLGTDPEKKTCDNPIDKHMKLAEIFETRGTPMIITEKGNILPGYVPADKLLKALTTEAATK
jgi:thiol:disulfide interchange protein DsbC